MKHFFKTFSMVLAVTAVVVLLESPSPGNPSASYGGLGSYGGSGWHGSWYGGHTWNGGWYGGRGFQPAPGFGYPNGGYDNPRQGNDPNHGNDLSHPGGK